MVHFRACNNCSVSIIGAILYSVLNRRCREFSETRQIEPQYLESLSDKALPPDLAKSRIHKESFRSFDISRNFRQHYYWLGCQISRRSDHCNVLPRGSETSRDIAWDDRPFHDLRIWIHNAPMEKWEERPIVRLFHMQIYLMRVIDDVMVISEITGLPVLSHWLGKGWQRVADHFFKISN